MTDVETKADAVEVDVGIVAEKEKGREGEKNYFTLKMEKAWHCILSQFSDLIQGQFYEHGPGMALFILSDRLTNGNNCEFNYIVKDSQGWLFLIPNFQQLLANYIPEEHVIVDVTIDVHGESVSQVRLLANDTLIQVPHVKASSS